jgi:hypothetical protein
LPIVADVPWAYRVAGDASASPLIADGFCQRRNGGLAWAVHRNVCLYQPCSHRTEVDDLAMSMQSEHLLAKLLNGEIRSSEIDLHYLQHDSVLVAGPIM